MQFITSTSHHMMAVCTKNHVKLHLQPTLVEHRWAPPAAAHGHSAPPPALPDAARQQSGHRRRARRPPCCPWGPTSGHTRTSNARLWGALGHLEPEYVSKSKGNSRFSSKTMVFEPRKRPSLAASAPIVRVPVLPEVEILHRSHADALRILRQLLLRSQPPNRPQQNPETWSHRDCHRILSSAAHLTKEAALLLYMLTSQLGRLYVVDPIVSTYIYIL